MEEIKKQPVYIHNADTAIKAVDALRTLLGTMVIIPNEETDPNTFKKIVTSSTQRPILEGEDRTKVKNKLLAIIDSLEV